MSLQLEQVFTALSVIIANTIAIVGLWFKMQNKIDRLEDEKSEAKRQIEAIWDWKDEHEKNANDMREKYNRELSKLEGANLVVNEQFKQIMNSLNDIKEEFADIRERLFNLEKK